MKKLFILPLLFLGLSCQHNPSRDPAAELTKAEKKDLKKILKNATPEFRNEAISRARVTSASYDANRIASTDLVAELEQICGPAFRYQKVTTPKGIQSYRWPRIECDYKQDDRSLGGASTKFNCEFENPDSKDGKTTRKVKYMNDISKPFKDTDLIESTLLNTLSKALGFHAEVYCPAEIVCRNCPSASPWMTDQSSGPPSTQNFTFPFAIVEFPFEALQITNPNPPKLGQGLNWDELRQVKADTPEKERLLRIEREAWLLWVNFVQHRDADAHNQRVSCVNPKIDKATGQPACESTIVYTHDYGRSFFRAQFSRWITTPVFKSNNDGFECRNELRRDLTHGRPGPGLIMEPVISAEARDLLVERMNRLTDEQWTSVFELSRTSEVTGISSDRWLKTIKGKIAEMQSANCQPFAAGTSVLGLKKK